MNTARAAGVAALVLASALLSGSLLSPSAWAAGSDLQLEPGAQGGALFSAGALAPGHPVSRCVAVTGSNVNGSPADVRLHGKVTGALAPGLLLRIELGTGGSYDDCAGFSGTSAFSGTLAGFGARHADFASGLRQTTDAATYRFTVELADDQQWQGLAATTQFVWEAQLEEPATAHSPSASGSPSPGPVPPGGPGSPDVGEAPGSTGPGPAAVAPSRPLPEMPPMPALPLERPQPLNREPEQGALVRAATRVLEALRSTADLAGQVAATGARAAGVPVGLVSLVALFLVTQDRIDRSDPRLRLSPLHAPSTLEFAPGDPA